jgi:uncharacterized protein (TIGR02117 family)
MLRRLLRVVVVLVGGAAAAVGLYFAAALALSRWPVNDDFTAPADGIPVALTSNGMHATLHLPVRAMNVDWTQTFPLAEFPAPPAEPETISFGWGSREFYLNVQTWGDLDVEHALIALTGIGRSALHVAYWPPLPRGEDHVAFRISPEAYRVLVAHIRAAIATDAAGRPRLIPGYSYRGNDRFYEATGTYTAFTTCNEWLRRGLAAAGIRTGVWSPFPDALLEHLRTP